MHRHFKRSLPIVVLLSLGYPFYIFILPELKPDEACFLNQNDSDSLHLMLSKFHEVAESVNFTYWVAFGTLLGTHRFQDIIPWDYDIDISYLEHEFPTLRFKIYLKLRSALRKTGDVVLWRGGVSKFFFKYQPKGSERIFSIDLQGFATAQEMVNELGYKSSDRLPYYTNFQKELKRPFSKDSILYSIYYPPETIFRWICYEDVVYNWVFPLQDCKIGNLTVKCPNKPTKILSSQYGYTWRLGLNIPFKIQCWIYPHNFIKVVMGEKC